MQLHQALKVQAAQRLNSGSGTPKSVAKRYKISERQAVKFQKDFNEGKLVKKGKNWNPDWDRPGVISHPVDREVMVDVLNGNTKDEGALIGMFDREFDGHNGLYHIEWAEDDWLAIVEGIPYRMLEIMRDSKPDSPLYCEAVEWMESEFFLKICTMLNIDAEKLLFEALCITKSEL